MFLLTDIGFSVSYPTVLTAALTGLNNKTNSNEILRMTGAQVSFLGKVYVILILLHVNFMLKSTHTCYLMNVALKPQNSINIAALSPLNIIFITRF